MFAWEKGTMNHFFKLNRFFGSDGDDPPPDPAPDPIPEPSIEKKFSQEDLNRIAAEERRKAQKSNEKVVKELEQLRQKASLTEQEKLEFDTRIETIRNEFLTKEELAKKETQRERNKQKQELEAKEKEAKHWRELYEETTADTSLLSAASSDPDIFNPQQILDLLKPKTRVVPELDESGKPTGKFMAKVRFIGKDQEGKEVVLELTPVEAVKQMKDLPERYGNLFKNGATGGLGGNNLTTADRGGKGPPKDPGLYREWRKKTSDHLNKM